MKAYCMKCLKPLDIAYTENKQNGTISLCDTCGDAGAYTALKDLLIMGDKVTCSCKAPKLTLKMHINMKPRSYFEYECHCGNLLSIS